MFRQEGSTTRWSSIQTSWEDLQSSILTTQQGAFLSHQSQLRQEGKGLPHADAKLRLFPGQRTTSSSSSSSSVEVPRLVFYRDTAGWCPYCQKVWIFLEEKGIPYQVEKINMRCYGDKPSWFLDMVPSGLLPVIRLDNGQVVTESLDIMLGLDRAFPAPDYPTMWPSNDAKVEARAMKLMKLERELYAAWCGLLFYPSPVTQSSSRRRLEEGFTMMNKELEVTSSPWFLDDLSIVDITYISHMERMCATVAYWNGWKIRGDGRWPAIERWMDAFEARPSYQATRGDYYTHAMDIPPQCGTPYPIAGYEVMAGKIDGRDGQSWKLPLPPLQESFEPISSAAALDDEAARHEAAYKLIMNHDAVISFALRGAGSPGRKKVSAPLADPFAQPNMLLKNGMDYLLRKLVSILLTGELPTVVEEQSKDGSAMNDEVVDKETQKKLVVSLAYLRDRVGVPRDMSYPAARQLRAHLNWLIDHIHKV
eukprot:gene4478-4906_t